MLPFVRSFAFWVRVTHCLGLSKPFRDSTDYFLGMVLRLITPHPTIMKIASTANPYGYSGMTVEIVNVTQGLIAETPFAAYVLS